MDSENTEACPPFQEEDATRPYSNQAVGNSDAHSMSWASISMPNQERRLDDYSRPERPSTAIMTEASGPVDAPSSSQPTPIALKPSPTVFDKHPAEAPNAGYDSTVMDRSLPFENEKDSESFNEQLFLHDTLPEVESSFVAPLSPLPTVSKDGLDDTLLYDSPRKASPPAAIFRASVIPESRTTSDRCDAADTSSNQPDNIPAENTKPVGELSTQQPTFSSSSNAEYPLPDTGRSSLRYGKRPRFLRSRNASQRSSASSLTSPDPPDDNGSDVTVGLGPGYALQSGVGISSIGGDSRGVESVPFSRSVSITSVDSTVNPFPDSHYKRNDDELLHTPKASQATLVPPTDTVLMRRVMDVQVPESLANEYKVKGGLVTPRKPSDLTTTGNTSSRRAGRSNMTLKEQSSTIERLSKENFDLKLKVMFLSDRLDKLSEDGVKEMIQENVEFRTSIAILQRDNKGLRRRVKELEKCLKDEDELRPGTAQSAHSSSNHVEADAQEKDELFFLRERVEEYSTTIDRLRHELLNKETERRRTADLVKSLQSTTGDRSFVDESNLGRQEEEDVWKDLLEQETARREQADEDNRKLRDEIFRLKQELHNGGNVYGDNTTRDLHHTTDIHDINKISQVTENSSHHREGGAFPQSGSLTDGDLSTSSTSHTLVNELRRESEQLRHENAELRKEVGAQTSMLTSRNREKERLYQEIEDLKMAQRRGGGPAPSTIDSLLDHSASQIGVGGRERPGSRASGGKLVMRAETVVGVNDQEREDLENRNAGLRDKINEAKLENQTLLQELEVVLQQKQEVEETALGVQRDYEGAMTDLMAMQAERDELIAELNDLEQKHNTLQVEFDDLRVEAQDAIDGFEEEADIKDEEMVKLQSDLTERTENFTSLQDEMRKLSEALVGLEDETASKVRRIQQLEQDLGEANKELEDLEARLLESNDKAQRLLVQQENSQGEIAFLREEQESDKITISRLEANVSKAEDMLREEQERVKQLQQQIVAERERSESLATKDKKEMQHIVNELSRDALAAKEEARKLRKSLTSREVEATEWKERLMELENNLREALGDLSGTRSSLLKSIAKLQRELENTVRELESTKAAVMEKDRLVKQRDALLESHGLEARKIAEALDKERTAHRHTKHQFETFQKTHQHVTRTVSTQDARISELETSKNQDKRRLSQLETTFKDQLHERNTLLLLLWTRLSALCGVDWAHDNSLVSGRALPSLEVVATMLSGFTRNLMAAIKHIESVVGGFPDRIKAVEKDLWREYQNLETSLDTRIKKLDRLEAVVRNGLASGALSSPELHNRLLRMEDAYRQLKVENATLRTASEVRARAAYNSTSSGVGNSIAVDIDPNVIGGSPSPSIPTGPRDRSRTSTMRSKSGSSRGGGIPRPTTGHSARALAAGELTFQDASNSTPGGELTASGDSYNTDPRWILRLRDLENKLKLEREGRMLDRNEAARRLREQEADLKWRSDRESKRSTS